MADLEGMDGFDDQVAALEGSLSTASGMAQAFNAELGRMGATMDTLGSDVSALNSGMSRGLKSAIDGIVLGGDTLSEAIEGLGRSMMQTVYNAALRPVTNHMGGLMSEAVGGLWNAFLPFADGGAFSQGRVTPFARGGVVTAPTTFPMRGGTGLMGEAGPEAIMPLTRGADGKLGVRAAGGGRPVQVTMNITTPDAAGFQRSQGQIAAQMNRAIARGNRYS
ncbi:MAG: phage tail protein [Rhodobacterales bacterium]|nr:MAG: phage tail protein [Rhodobacterales bacterium]